MEYTGRIVAQVAIMFILIIVGYICFKLKVITDDGRKQMSSLVINIIAPAMIFMAYQKEFSTQLLSGLMWAFLLSVISYIITIPLTLLLVRKSKKHEYVIERFALIFTNCAFMGIPLIQALFGSDGVLYVTAYITLFNLLVWTYGVMLIKSEVSFKGLINSLKSPTVISVFLGIICYVTNIRLPEIPAQACQFVADMNTPVAMLTAGATMAQTDMLKAIKNPRTLLMCFYRLLVLPLVCAAVFKLFPVPDHIYTTIVVATACPTATMLILFAVNYDKNDLYASELFSITTLLSAITLPVVLTLISFL